MSPNRKARHEELRSLASTGHITDQSLYREIRLAQLLAEGELLTGEAGAGSFWSAAMELSLAADLAKAMARRLEAQKRAA